MLTKSTQGSQWNEQIIHQLGGQPDGAVPFTKPHLDAEGNVFLVTSQGGSNNIGALIELSPPPPGSTEWTETILYNFGSAVDGIGPTGGLEDDGNGGFYVAVSNETYDNSALSAVIDLQPPAAGGTAWSENVLYVFRGYSSQNGVVPFGGVITDGKGNLFGTTVSGGPTGCGTVYELSPPTGGVGYWTETVLYLYTGLQDGCHPTHAPHLDAAGNLFTVARQSPGARGFGGSVIELSPPAAGQTAWTETTLYDFKGEPDGDAPSGAFTVDEAGNFLIPTFSGGQYNHGTITELTGTGFVVK